MQDPPSTELTGVNYLWEESPGDYCGSESIFCHCMGRHSFIKDFCKEFEEKRLFLKTRESLTLSPQLPATGKWQGLVSKCRLDRSY